MNEEKRFVEDHSYLINYDKYCILDKMQHKHLYLDEVIDLLNEQDKKLNEITETNEILNEYIRVSDELDKEKLEVLRDVETEIKLLNSYLVEKGLAEDYIRWAKELEG